VLPPRLAAIVDELSSAPPELKVEFLVDYAERLPALPPRLRDHSGMEQVPECTSPLLVCAELASDGTVTPWFDCPVEAPTVRAFAGLLAQGLAGASSDEVLSVPDEIVEELGLDEAISPQRLAGMTSVMARLKRQVRAQARAA
jgi:cysteine desulfuration protein SufE